MQENMTTKPIQAVAVFDGSKIKGTVYFTENRDKTAVIIEVNISGLKKNFQHGFHVHECGDLTDKCESMCAHFIQLNINPCIGFIFNYIILTDFIG